MRSLRFCLMSVCLLANLIGCVPAFAQPPVEAAVPVMGEPTAQSLGAFRAALIKEAEAAVKAKTLTRGELFRLRIATMNKATLEKMHQACAEQTLADGKAASYSAIDWSKLAEIIKEMLPVILELIKLFADAGPISTQNIALHYAGFPVFSLAA